MFDYIVFILVVITNYQNIHSTGDRGTKTIAVNTCTDNIVTNIITTMVIE